MAAPKKIDGQTFRSVVSLFVVIVVTRAFLLMLALGILHLQWSASVPALSFWECTVLSAAYAAVRR